VDLAAVIDGEQLLADPGVEGRRGEVPGADLVVLAEQGEELREIDAALADAGTGADGGVEGLGIAGVHHLHQALLAAGEPTCHLPTLARRLDQTAPGLIRRQVY
jgi:hypothetical protein